MHITGKQVVLRAVEAADLPLFNQWGNDPDLWRLLGGWHFPVSSISTRNWFDRLEGDPANLRLAITTADLGTVGLANLLDLDWKNRHASHGIMLGDANARRRGIGRDAVMAMMRYAFDELGLVRLDSTIIEHNEPSLALYCGKCGWRQEGRQREWYFREGRYWDRIMIGITRSEYTALVQTTRYWTS